MPDLLCAGKALGGGWPLAAVLMREAHAGAWQAAAPWSGETLHSATFYAHPVACAALDECHAAGTCNPADGTCSNPAKADDTACNDGDLFGLAQPMRKDKCATHKLIGFTWINPQNHRDFNGFVEFRKSDFLDQSQRIA